MSPMPPKEMSQADQTLKREWAQEDDKAVRQRTGRQSSTKHDAETLPLNVYEKELHLGRVFHQDSEYDSGSDEEEREGAKDEEEDSLDLNAIKFLSRSVRTRSIRVISLSHRALASYRWTNFFERSTAARLSTTASFWAYEYGLLAPLF